MIDTHSHIYSEEFDADITDVIQRAKDVGVQHIILPNVDRDTLSRMLKLESDYPDYCHACIGLHPTYVKAEYDDELAIVKNELERRKYFAIGEIGIDLYWDKTFLKEQIIVFQQQIEWALEYDLPVIIHVRNSFNETMNALAPFKKRGLTGVFHSFTGSIETAREIIKMGGFKFGINGTVTYKNSGLPAVLQQIDLEYLLLETDSPYLTPVPHRGKRNESAYTLLIANKLAEVYNCSLEQIDEQTTCNAKLLFAI
ncbi:MAG: TatD family hydrolase [Bacteroidota bacterium]